MTVLEQQLESRRNLAINGVAVNGGDGPAGGLKKPSTRAPDGPSTTKSKHRFSRAKGGFPNSQPTETSSNKNAGGGQTREFYVNPDDKYEDHPSNGLGDPFEPMDGWILDEVDQKQEEGDLTWDAAGVNVGGGDGSDALPDFKVDVSVFIWGGGEGGPLLFGPFCVLAFSVPLLYSLKRWLAVSALG